MEIRLVDDDKKRFMPLLLLGDEQESMIDRYLDRGDLYVMQAADGTVAAVAVVTHEGEGVCELKNIAVSVQLQRQGIGRKMVEYLCRRYKAQYATMLVGTGDSLATTEFYATCGFEYSHTVPDFFTLNYDHPIIENGTLLKDMIYFKRKL